MTDKPHTQLIPIDNELMKNPILKKLNNYFESRQEDILKLKEAKPSDEKIREFISNAFGIYGGGSLNPEGWYGYAGGRSPRLELQDKQFVLTHKLEGQQLVEAFRLVFKIPVGDQLNLF